MVIRWLSGLAVVLACFCFSGCATQLYDNLVEAEANAIIAALRENDIFAEKRPGTEGSFCVFIEETDFARAVRILDTHALPGKRYDDLGQVFGKDAMFSTPMEEKARYLYAMQEELSHTIALIDGVVAARVHLVMPEQDQLGRQLQTPSAAIFVKHSDDERHDPTRLQVEIRRLISASVPNLTEEAIVIAFFAAEPLPPPQLRINREVVLLGVKIAPESVIHFWQILAGAVGIGLVLASSLMFIFLRRRIRQ